MFVSRTFVYVELQKTACIHIRGILKELCDGEFVGMNNQVSSSLFHQGRLFLGSIRDPWEWYASLWAYGCDNKGAVFQQVTKPGTRIRGLGWRRHPYDAFLALLSGLYRDSEKWKDTYRDVNDAGAFRAWLYMMHDAKYYHDIGEGYGACTMSRIAGLLTFRYLKLYCTKEEESTNLHDLSTYSQLAEYENERCFIDRFIRNETLESDLFHALESSGVEISNSKRSEIQLLPRSNVSSKKHGASYYYDSETEELVANRERIIAEKFGYVAPSLRDKFSDE